MQSSTNTNLVQDATSPGGVTEGPLYEFTPEQVKAVEETRQGLNFTPEEVEERLRRTQAGLKRIAAATTLQEQQRVGAEVWAERVERPRAARRIETARRVAPRPASRPTRPGRVVVKRRSRAAGTATPSRGDPDAGDPEPGEPWALTWFDRAPVVWRLRAARCRLLEVREGIDR